MYLESGSYVCCTGNAVNKIDPWGLNEITTWYESSKQKSSAQPLSPVSPGLMNPDLTERSAEYQREIAKMGQRKRATRVNADQFGFLSGRGCTIETAIFLPEVIVPAFPRNEPQLLQSTRVVASSVGPSLVWTFMVDLQTQPRDVLLAMATGWV